MSEYNQGETVWIDSFHGVRSATVVALFPKKNRIVVESGGEPEIVEGDRVFSKELACCAAAAMRLQNEVSQKMATVAKLSEKVAIGEPQDECAAAT